MDGRMNKADGSEGTGSHIWLRYATQFTMNGRNVTVEMGIPVPLGASAETREQLIREAEEGMEQLSNHIEGRIGQMVQRIQQTPATKQPATRTANTPTAATTPAPATPAPTPKPSTPVQPTQPSQPAQTPPSRETAPVASQEKGATNPPARMNVGASMPNMLATGDTAGNLSLPQFIQIIRESLNLTPKQAMDVLKVKSLSGLNYRTALDDLQTITASGSVDTQEPPLKLRDESSSRGREQPAANTSTRNTTEQPQEQAPRSNIVPISKKMPYEEITHAVIRETPPTYPAFDEELDDTDIEFEDETNGYPELTQHEREIAEEILNRLKDAKGSSAASATRLTVLNNVIGGQISDEQLQQLIQGVWEINSVKKLKNEQVEALVYWGKDDNFIEEVELVLTLLAEGDYARSDR